MRDNDIADRVEHGLAILKQAGLKLNVNDSKLIRELLTDLARKDNQDPVEFIDSPILAAILTDKKLNGPQKLARVKDHLTSLRYPVFTKAESVFLAEIKDLKLHPNIKISHTPYFEDNVINVQFRYDDVSQLRAIIRSLEKLVDRDPVKDALETAENLS